MVLSACFHKYSQFSI